MILTMGGRGGIEEKRKHKYYKKDPDAQACEWLSRETLEVGNCAMVFIRRKDYKKNSCNPKHKQVRGNLLFPPPAPQLNKL